MQILLGNVLDNYVNTRAFLRGRANIVHSPDQISLLDKLPARIESHLAKRGLADLYKVKGSIGNGNIARVPWVGIFRTSVTKNAENGFYIVLLFSEDMSSCYLSLNQGITAVERLYTKEFAWKKMREAARRAVLNLERHPEALFGPVDLSSTGDLGRGYEAAAIESFRYLRTDLPNDQIFFSDFDHLLHSYETLISRYGTDLYSLFSVSEDEFQQVALEKAAALSRVQSDETGGVEVSLATKLGSRGFVRSPTVAACAIRAANFSCEIDPAHWSFTSRAKKQRYVEAHHLIPISQQAGFPYSLDVIANVVSLCATCHRLLHYGAPGEKNVLLRSLLNGRRSQLLLKSIEVKYSDFLEFYGKGMLVDD
jgi:5-methylcytosine-specific restriction protein A